MIGMGDMASVRRGHRWFHVHPAVATSVMMPTMDHTRRSTDVRPRNNSRSESKYRYGVR